MRSRTKAGGIIGLLPAAGEIVSGRLHLGDADLRALSPAAAQRLRPQTSLNPLMTIECQLVETIQAHEDIGTDAARRRSLGGSR